MPEPISHAEMLAAVCDAIEGAEMDAQGYRSGASISDGDERLLREAEEYQRHADTLRAVLAHLERTQWHDIVNAPKDKDWLLVGWESYDKGIAGYSDAAFWHDGSDNYWKRAGWYALEDRRNVLTAKPLTGMTHWMLPPSPETPR